MFNDLLPTPWAELANLLLPLLISYLSGLLTPATCRRIVAPLLGWIGRGIAAGARKTAAVLTRKPDPQMATLLAMQAEMLKSMQVLARTWEVECPDQPAPNQAQNSQYPGMAGRTWQ